LGLHWTDKVQRFFNTLGFSFSWLSIKPKLVEQAILWAGFIPARLSFQNIRILFLCAYKLFTQKTDMINWWDAMAVIDGIKVDDKNCQALRKLLAIRPNG
jgi:hypothetical protein